MKFLRYAALLIALCFASQAMAASRYAVCPTTCTWDGSTGGMWATVSGGSVTGVTSPGSADTATFDANTCVGGTTCTITVNTNPSVLGVTFGACTASTGGCILDFSVNNNSFTIGGGGFSGTGTGTRTLKMGSNTWTNNATGGSGWNWSTATNATLNAGTSTLNFSGTLSAFASYQFGASFTYATVNFGAQTSGQGSEIVCTSCTFGTIGITAPNFLDFGSATTITNALAWAGSSAASTITLVGNNNTLTVASGSTIAWASLVGMHFSQSVTAINSFNSGGNTNAAITGPSGTGGGFVFGE